MKKPFQDPVPREGEAQRDMPYFAVGPRRPRPRAPLAALRLFQRFAYGRPSFTDFFLVHVATLVFEVERESMFDKCVGTIHIPALHLLGDALFEFRAEADIHG